MVDPDAKILLCIPAFAADAAAVNPDGIKTKTLILFLVIPREPKSLPRNPPDDCAVLDNSIFDSLISVDK